MHTTRYQTLKHPRSRGFTLIEVLIAVLVLSIGLLGLAALQATGMKNNHSAHLQSQAIVAAYDIVDRMRANRSAALNNEYDINLGGSITSSGIAQADLTQWKNQIAATLPSGDGSVDYNGGVITVVIQWDDSRATDGSGTQQFTFETEI